MQTQTDRQNREVERERGGARKGEEIVQRKLNRSKEVFKKN
jgi:hypothetical protein